MNIPVINPLRGKKGVETDMSENYEMISVEDLMKMLHLGKNTAYELLKNKELKCFQIRGRYKIPKISVYEYIEKQRNAIS